MGLPLAAQFASHGWNVIAVDVNDRRRRRDQRRPVARRRASPGSPELRRATSTQPDGCARRLDGAAAAARGGRRRPDRAGHARRRQPARLPLHGRRGRRDRARHPRRSDRHLRDDAARRRHARPLRPALERASGLEADRDLFVAFSPERLFTGRRPPQPRDLPQARRRRRAGVDRSRRAVLRIGAGCGGRRDELGRGRGAQQARRHDVPGREHRLRQRARRLRGRRARRSTSRRSSRRRTASRTATSTSPASASAATASPSIRTSSSRARRASRIVEAARAVERRPGRRARLRLLDASPRRTRRTSRSSSSG